MTFDNIETGQEDYLMAAMNRECGLDVRECDETRPHVHDDADQSVKVERRYDGVVSDPSDLDIPYPMGRAGRGVLPKGAPLPRMVLTLEGNYLGVDLEETGFGQNMSDQAARVARIIIDALILFAEKNQGYGNTAYNLGARGQYADMNRKFGKLKHILWDGNPAVGESIEEICKDFIGHCGLTIDFVNQEGIK